MISFLVHASVPASFLPALGMITHVFQHASSFGWDQTDQREDCQSN